MHGEEHIRAATLEQYSLQMSGPTALDAVEYHLEICAACRDRLERIEPFNMIHFTPEGHFHSRITQMQDAHYWAHYWNCQIHDGRSFRDRDDAVTYLLDSFIKLFPEHECSKLCDGVCAPFR